jgi:hypothetical protein
MTPKRTTRDPSASRAFGTKPFTGRRYVSNGKVRIEWKEAGRRRSRTVGPDSSAARAEADAEVQAILEGLRSEGSAAGEPSGDAQENEPPQILDALVQLATAILDAADSLIDRLRDALEGDRE